MTLFETKDPPTDLLSSTLLNEDTFYPVFIKDLKRCKSEVIINRLSYGVKVDSAMLKVVS
jgi:hypothetical protein